MKKRMSIRMLAEGGIMIALATVLSYAQVYKAPNGGSVTAGSMIPIMLFAIRWGVLPGLTVGATYGVLQFILEPFFLNPAQFILDYPLAFGLLGLAGILYHIKDNNSLKGYTGLSLGVALAILGRMASHVISGAIYFADAVEGQNPWIFSIGYNATYLVPELIISVVVLILLWKPLERIIKN